MKSEKKTIKSVINYYRMSNARRQFMKLQKGAEILKFEKAQHRQFGGYYEAWVKYDPDEEEMEFRYFEFWEALEEIEDNREVRRVFCGQVDA